LLVFLVHFLRLRAIALALRFLEAARYRACASLAVYAGEFLFEVSTFQAYNLKNFVSTPFSRGEQNGRPRHTQISCYELDGGLVRFSLNRRRIEAQNQLPFPVSRKFRSLCIGDHADPHLYHWRSPKSAEPMRTMVAPSSMATSKSWLIPIESSGRRNRRPSSQSLRK
jgi:hypothetical protein